MDREVFNLNKKNMKRAETLSIESWKQSQSGEWIIFTTIRKFKKHYTSLK